MEFIIIMELVENVRAGCLRGEEVGRLSTDLTHKKLKLLMCFLYKSSIRGFNVERY